MSRASSSSAPSRPRPSHEEPDRVRPQVDRGEPAAAAPRSGSARPRAGATHARPGRRRPRGGTRSARAGTSRRCARRPRRPSLGARRRPRRAPRVGRMRAPRAGAKVRVDLRLARRAARSSPRTPARRHGLDRIGAREPVERGERIAHGVERRVADHQRVTAACTARPRRTAVGRLSPELLADRFEVGGWRWPRARGVRAATCACARRRA